MFYIVLPHASRAIFKLQATTDNWFGLLSVIALFDAIACYCGIPKSNTLAIPFWASVQA